MKTALSIHHPTWSMGKGMKQRPFDFKDTFLGRDFHIDLEYCGENFDYWGMHILCLQETDPEGVWVLLENGVWGLGQLAIFNAWCQVLVPFGYLSGCPFLERSCFGGMSILLCASPWWDIFTSSQAMYLEFIFPGCSFPAWHLLSVAMGGGGSESEEGCWNGKILDVRGGRCQMGGVSWDPDRKQACSRNISSEVVRLGKGREGDALQSLIIPSES